jgi:hypothetical protein
MTKKVSKYSEGICFCNDIDEIEGVDAQAYCSKHLKKLFVDGKKWQITYICPVTDIQWLEDYPDSEYHGGGSPRLRRLPLNS